MADSLADSLLECEFRATSEQPSDAGHSAVAMTEQSPLIDQLGRLAALLREYGRDDVWLHVTQIHPFTSQHIQVVVTVKDKRGALLEERSGRLRSHTFRLNRTVPTIDVGHRFHVVRDEAGVRVRHVPAFSSP